MVSNVDLIDDLARKRVVLFLGAGVSASAITHDGKRMKGWGDFLDETTKHVTIKLRRQVKNLLRSKDYLLACELLQQELKSRWPDLITAEYGQAAEPSQLHNSLVGPQQNIVLTTNFDKIAEIAWEKRPVGGLLPKTLYEIDSEVFRILKEHGQTHILKIHGSVDKPSSLVFSRSEYIKNAFGNENYNIFIESLLLNYTFLYVGFSMDDPAITSIMESYALKYKTARPHYILFAGKMENNIKDLNRDMRKLIVLQYGGVGEYEKLPDFIDKMGAEAELKRKELIADTLSGHI